MPHGTIRIGGVEVTALCDLAWPFPRTMTDAFPGVPSRDWPEFRRRYPDTFGPNDQWLFHVHCYLVRAEKTVLVDAGIGPASTVAASWVGASGRLPEELEAAGAAPADIDVVVLTHVHLDHIGWGLTANAEGNPEPTFPRARYLVQRQEWDGFYELGDPDDRAAFDRHVRPLDALGLLELVDGEWQLGPGLMLVPTPGHTPGHQSLLIQGDGGGALLAGDLTNHPAQVTEPRWATSSDMDPALAAWSRRRWLDRVESEEMMLVTAHYPQPFGVLVRENGRRYFHRA